VPTNDRARVKIDSERDGNEAGAGSDVGEIGDGIFGTKDIACGARAAVDVVVQIVTGGVSVHTLLDSPNAPTAHTSPILDRASPTVLENSQVRLEFGSNHGPTLVTEGILNEP
jgi:hypothetical protein